MTMAETIRNHEGLRENDSAAKDKGRAVSHLGEQYHRLPIAFCKLDLAGMISGCNDLFENLVGFLSEELAGKSFFALLEMQSKSALEDLVYSSKRGVIRELVSLKCKDGTVIPVSLAARPEVEHDGTVSAYGVTLIDETQSQKKIEQAEKERDEMKNKERLKDEFIAVASHELRTPIQPILGYALLAKKKRISEEAAWDAVLREARRLQQLANDILDVSRIDSGVLEYSLKREKINEIIDSMADSMRADIHNRIGNKKVSLEVIRDPSENDIEVEMDKSRIIQVLTNIAGNAVKFTQEGTVTLKSKAHPERNEFEIIVSDTGLGIPEEIQPILFEKFATKGHGDASQHKGNGLGLYICKAIIKAHKGSITAFNNPGASGATFRIVIPISQNGPEVVAKQ